MLFFLFAPLAERVATESRIYTDEKLLCNFYFVPQKPKRAQKYFCVFLRNLRAFIYLPLGKGLPRMSRIYTDEKLLCNFCSAESGRRRVTWCLLLAPEAFE